MADRTLIDSELLALANRLLEPFEPNGVKGSSYDIRVGSAAIQNVDGKSQSIALGQPPLQDCVLIPPGSSCLIQSLEKIHISNKMKGRLSLRAFHAKRLIFFAGGIIDPGYDDYLFLPLANLGDAPIELKYGDALVTAEFVELDKAARSYNRPAVTPNPTTENIVLLDRVKLSKEVRAHDEIIQKILKRLESNELMTNASQRILDFIVLATIASGSIAAVIILMPNLQPPWNYIVVSIGIIAGMLSIWFLIRMTHRQSQK
jgi:deoxycytidine triphosphate deaminase